MAQNPNKNGMKTEWKWIKNTVFHFIFGRFLFFHGSKTKHGRVQISDVSSFWVFSFRIPTLVWYLNGGPLSIVVIGQNPEDCNNSRPVLKSLLLRSLLYPML
jgi:hypothetical protein